METAHLYAVNVLGDRYEIDRPGPDQAVQSCRVGGKFDVRWLSLQNMKRIGMSAKRPVLLGNSFAAEFRNAQRIQRSRAIGDYAEFGVLGSLLLYLINIVFIIFIIAIAFEVKLVILFKVQIG